VLLQASPIFLIANIKLQELAPKTLSHCRSIPDCAVGQDYLLTSALNLSAIASPMPRAAPVMTHCLPEAVS
jgi:hypothetical protein